MTGKLYECSDLEGQVSKWPGMEFFNKPTI